MLLSIRVDRTVRAVVLRGNGRAFCSGGDIREFGSAPSPVVAREVRWQRDVWGRCAASATDDRGDSWPRCRERPGDGAACDFRIAARDAVLSLPETGLGMIPGVVGAQTLPRAVGVDRALDLVLTARAIDARPRSDRMVGSVVARGQLRAEAARLARRLAKIDGELVFRKTPLRTVPIYRWQRRSTERILGERPKA
jgi:enoyl-CoA hydratase/carnithine racemase